MQGANHGVTNETRDVSGRIVCEGHLMIVVAERNQRVDMGWYLRSCHVVVGQVS